MCRPISLKCSPFYRVLRKWFIRSAWQCFLFLLTVQSHAQVQSNAIDPQTAQDLYRKGEAAYLQNDLKRARDFYYASLKREQATLVECQLAQVLSELQEWTEAYFRLLNCVELLKGKSEHNEKEKKIRMLSYEVRSQLDEQQALAVRARIDTLRQEKLEAETQQSLNQQGEPQVDELAASKRKARIKKRLVLSLAGVGLVSASASIPLFILSNSARRSATNLRVDLLARGDDCVQPSTECRALHQHLKSWDRRKNAASGLLIAGGISLVSAVLVQVIWKMDPAETSLTPFWWRQGRRDQLWGIQKSF